MPVVKTLARDWKFHINTGTTVTPIWTAIGGINTQAWSETKNDANTTTYDDAGWLSHLPASRGKSLTLSGLFAEDPATGARDAGQAACKTLATQIGSAGLKMFKATTPGNTTIIGTGSCQVTEGGGGNDDPSAWELVITFSGALTVAP